MSHDHEAQLSRRPERDRRVPGEDLGTDGMMEIWNTRHARSYTMCTAVGFGAVRAQAVVVTDKIVWECCRDRFVCFFIFLSIPRRRRRRRCTRTYRHPAPDQQRCPAVYWRWNAPERVRATAAAHGRFFCACPVAFKMKRIFFPFITIPSTLQPVIVTTTLLLLLYSTNECDARYYYSVVTASCVWRQLVHTCRVTRGGRGDRHQKGLRDVHSNDRVGEFGIFISILFFFYFSYTRPEDTADVSAIASHSIPDVTKALRPPKVPHRIVFTFMRNGPSRGASTISPRASSYKM